jgi:hypothetical protein
MIFSFLPKRKMDADDPMAPMFPRTNPFRDFWDYIRESRPHRWTSLGLAMAIGFVLIWGLNRYLVRPIPQETKLVYFENFNENRSDADVRRDWVERLKQANQRNAKRRAQYQEMAKMMNIPYDASQADADTEAILNANYDEFIRTGKLPDEVLAKPKKPAENPPAK